MSDHLELSTAYWAGAARGVLVVQRCADCGTPRHYPRAVCAHCYSFATEHVEHDGRGTVHSWTVAHHSFDPAMANDVPYVLVTVDLGDGMRALGRLRDAEPALDLPVRLAFEPDANGEPMPTFHPIIEVSA
ncbi:MAG: Zn-ribbon domain-containing OB-fold protein [Sporichthyaceae bacterium]